MLDKKQIWGIFLFKFKMGYKAAEITSNINNAFGPETANEHTGQWWWLVQDRACREERGPEGQEVSDVAEPSTTARFLA